MVSGTVVGSTRSVMVGALPTLSISWLNSSVGSSAGRGLDDKLFHCHSDR